MNFFARLVPFILFGVAIVAFVFGLLLLTYLLAFGAVVGLVLFLAAWIKEKFFVSKQIMKSPPSKKTGRTIDHDNN